MRRATKYILLLDDNTYGNNQDFLKKKTYILDLDMINNNDIVKEIDISSKLTPFVNEYISSKGAENSNCSIEYFEIENMLTPPEINAETEVAFKVYYRSIDGNNIETSLGSEAYAYNVKTDTIRDLGSID